ncbi:MAG: sensor histidine kinase [Granulosicoccaceae bacterium]
MSRAAKPVSIHRRLLVRLSIPLLFLSCLIATVLYWFSVANANRAFDRALLGASLAIADRVVMEGEELLVDLPYVALEMLSATAEERVYYRVSDRSGKPVTGYEELPEPGSRPWLNSTEDAEWFYNTRYLQQSVRVAVISRVALGGATPTRFLVYVAETDNNRRDLALRLLLVFGSGMALLAVVVMLLVWVSLRRGLAPLAKFSRALQARTAADLHPLDLPVPVELEPVEASINQLLRRLSRHQLEQKRFVEDASHQLRTPLAALKAQLSLADSPQAPVQVREELQQAQRTLDRSIRLSQQLLSHARAVDTGQLREIDLDPLVADVCREWVPIALKHQMDLGYQAPQQAVPILGDEILLQEMLRNLIENAVLYGEAGMMINVSLNRRADGAELLVADTGAPIETTQRERLFDRFYRPAGSGGSGSGLGLAIVRNIAHLHGGGAALLDDADTGNCFVIRLASKPPAWTENESGSA